MEVLLVKDGVVDTVISVDSMLQLQDYYPEHQLIERTGEESTGWKYSGGLFTPPASVDIIDSWKISRLAFISRFTDAEAIAIDLASSGTTVQQAAIRRLFQKVNASEYIDLKRTDTITGVNMLVQFQLLTQARADEILNTVPTVKEIYRGNV